LPASRDISMTYRNVLKFSSSTEVSMATQITEVAYSEINQDSIQQAKSFVKDSYTDCIHPIGETYYQFALEVLTILRSIHMDSDALAAAMLHYLPGISNITFDELQRRFGKDIRDLVEKTSALDKLEWMNLPLVKKERNRAIVSCSEKHESPERVAILRRMYLLALGEEKNEDFVTASATARFFQKREKQTENLLKMFLASTDDIRAIIIKIVDRLNMLRRLIKLRQLPDYPINSTNCSQFARVGLTIYASLADRLGLWELKSQIEDVSFEFLYPEKFNAINALLVQGEVEQKKYIDEYIIPAIYRELSKEEVIAKVSGRAKHIYSIYRKMEEKNFSFKEINDLLGVRIIVSTKDDCYKVQSILHQKWQPVTEVYNGATGRDWIANPKRNLYQSLHTTILINGKKVEVQIRTHEMHQMAEYGVAAHWMYKNIKRYKKSGTTNRKSRNEGQLRSQQLAALRANALDIQNPVDKRDWVFVITPVGHVVGLQAPTGATPLDLAYRLHTELGHMYGGAKIIGGHTVGIDYVLQNGDCIEIFKARGRQSPNPQWLTRMKDEDGKVRYQFARTRQARAKILRWLRRERLQGATIDTKPVDAIKTKQTR